jgi:hypothetical protein
MPARRRVGAGDNVESAWSPSAPRVGIRVGTDPPHASTLALLLEVIAINLRHLHWPKRHADLMLDHQVRESRAVHQKDALDGARELDGLRREARSDDEHALVGALAGEGSVEPL